MTIQFRCANKWLKFVNDVNCDSHKETVTRASNWAACHQESSEQMPSARTTSILLPLIKWKHKFSSYGQALYGGFAENYPGH